MDNWANFACRWWYEYFKSLKLHVINEKAAAENAAKGTTSQKIGDFWTTAMDSITIEKQGIAPLKPEFDEINGITDLIPANIWPVEFQFVAHVSRIGMGEISLP